MLKAVNWGPFLVSFILLIHHRSALDKIHLDLVQRERASERASERAEKGCNLLTYVAQTFVVRT